MPTFFPIFLYKLFLEPNRMECNKDRKAFPSSFFALNVHTKIKQNKNETVQNKEQAKQLFINASFLTHVAFWIFNI